MAKYHFGLYKRTHEISVRSRCGRKDNKNFGLYAPSHTVNQIFLIVRSFVEEELPLILQENIKYDEPKTRDGTYNIVVMAEGMMSRSITVKMPSYGAENIANELVKHLCDGNKLTE